METATALTIGEAASRAGVPPKTIRFYESIGLIAPAQRAANRYRSYDQDSVRRLRFIARARGLGFALKEVAALLALYGDRHRSSHDVKRLALDQIATLDRKIAELTTIRRSLADLAERCHGDDRPDCPILDELESPGA
ncbi:MAG: HTH-type transcriptional regulator HmrR [Rhodospirillales bacterium]|jgi:MerR family copper efflux transcriptional regulator|nr:HTH-type transcriptional regulator HmrR [Rhodospirillales bacterium]